MRELNILPMLEISQIFSNIELVKDASKDLCKYFGEIVHEFEEYSAVGEVFLAKVDELVPIFANYGSNQRTAQNTFDRLKNKKKFAKFLNVCLFILFIYFLKFF